MLVPQRDSQENLISKTLCSFRLTPSGLSLIQSVQVTLIWRAWTVPFKCSEASRLSYLIYQASVWAPDPFRSAVSTPERTSSSPCSIWDGRPETWLPVLRPPLPPRKMSAHRIPAGQNAFKPTWIQPPVVQPSCHRFLSVRCAPSAWAVDNSTDPAVHRKPFRDITQWLTRRKRFCYPSFVDLGDKLSGELITIRSYHPA